MVKLTHQRNGISAIQFFIFLILSLFFLWNCKKSSDGVQPNSPSINKVTPGEALAGSNINLSGNHFTGITEVLVNKMHSNFTIKSDSLIELTIPASLTPGETKVQVVVQKDTSAAQTFYVIVEGPKPIITSLLPAKNIPSQQIMIYGKNLMGVSKIMLGTTNINIDDKTDIAITLKVPKVTVGNYKLNVFANTGSSNKSDFEIVSVMPEGGFSPPPSIIVATPPPPGYVPGVTNAWQAPDEFSKTIFPRMDLKDPNNINIFTLGDCGQTRTFGFSTDCSYFASASSREDFSINGDGLVNMDFVNGAFNNYVELILHFPAKYGGDEKFVGRFSNAIDTDCNYKNSEIILISTRTGRQWRIK